MRVACFVLVSAVATTLPTAARALAVPTAMNIYTSPAVDLAIFLAQDATADESFAAAELAGWLGNATAGKPLKVATAAPPSGGASTITLAVGYGAATAVGLPAESLEGLGNESFVVSSNATGLAKGSIAISGGKHARRGALYGAYHLLNAWGFRFYAPEETVVPTAATIMAVATNQINTTYGPLMELRSLESYETNGGDDQSNHSWELRNRGNGCDGQPSGGCMVYAYPPGSVHTSYLLFGSSDGRTPPADILKAHPSWCDSHTDV